MPAMAAEHTQTRPAPKWRERLDNYKGAGIPPAHVPLAGLALAACLLSALVLAAPEQSLPPAERVLLALKCLPLMGALFFGETLLGALARVPSAKASAEPAAVVAAGVQPFRVIQANRIHMNHIENAAAFVPSLLAFAAFEDSARWIPALVVTWTVGRVIYRVGYVSDLPLNRLVGMIVSVTALLIPLTRTLCRFVTDVLLPTYA